MIPQYHSQTIDPKTLNALSSPNFIAEKKLFWKKTMMPK
jgi:hypothetical protein